MGGVWVSGGVDWSLVLGMYSGMKRVQLIKKLEKLWRDDGSLNHDIQIPELLDDLATVGFPQASAMYLKALLHETI